MHSLQSSLDKMASSDEFYITLLSNDSIDKYPENVLSSFVNYMESPLLLQGEWLVGLSEIYLNQYKTKDAESIGENQTELLFIYLDIMRPRIVGDQLVRCLKVLPLKPQNDVHIQFGRIEYHPLDTWYIRSIKTAILDNESVRIKFEESSIPTLITLHFKKKSL